MIRRQVIIIFFMVLLASSVSYAQEQFSRRYNITHITMDNGLLHNFIDDIYKDKLGFLWISTRGGGLSRYDGYEFIHYNTNASSRIKLKSNFIRNVYEDDYNRLWIVTDGGTDIFDFTTQQLVIPQDSQKKLLSLVEKPAQSVIKDSKGAIWLYCGNSLNRITFHNDGSISGISTLSSIPSVRHTFAMNDLDMDGNIWVNINSQICKVYPEEDSLKVVPVSPLLALENGILVSSFCMKENEIWIGTDRGLYRYNKNEEIVKNYEHKRGDPRSITQNYVTDIKITQDKQLIISTFIGINIYNPVADDFEHVTLENQLNSNFVNCMAVDEDIIWIATETGGINKMTPRRLSVYNYIHDKGNSSSISPNPVNAIYEDHKENLWVGTVEGGLNKKIKNSDRFIHYTSDSPTLLSHNSVSTITADENDRLWIGTWGNGITLLNLNDPKHRAVKYISSQTHPNFPIDFIGSLCYDSINNGVWIGTNPGIYFYHLATDKIYLPMDKEQIDNAYDCLGSIIDSSGNLWMGSLEGMYVIDLHSRDNNFKFKYKHLKYKPDDPSSGLAEKISCFCLSGNGTIWIGSNGSGIYKYQPEKNIEEAFTLYSTEHGLINNNVRGILEDEKGIIWISTNNGISCLDPSTNQFINYTKEDGLTDNQFYWNAFYRSRDGLLYFGSLSGLTVIESNRKKLSPRPAHVTFTRLRVSNEEIISGSKHIDTCISMAKTLRLHESDKSFSLEFSALNYDSHPMAGYSYSLLGFDEEWVEVPASRRFASYTNIPPGKYTLQVKYNMDGNADNNSIAELEVIVTPFFYKTTWFAFLAIMLISCSAIYYYIHHIRRLQKQKELLHQMVQERTKELVEQNEKITKQKNQLIKMSKKVQELTLDKLAFFTNITHEFRTPITLIIGPIERALKLSSNPQVIEQLNFVERNSKYLLSLVNQLMDFRKVESGKLEITKEKGDFLQFINSLIIPFRAFAGDRHITIRTFYRFPDPKILFDQDAMQKVITNLLSNAIKFTPDGGNVCVYIMSYIDKTSKKEKLFINIKDTGTGVDEEDIPKIFNRFYQSKNHVKFPVYGQSGTGIGLYLCQRIIKLHGGTINARNNKCGGSSFHIVLPLIREDKAVVENSNTDYALIQQGQKNEGTHYFNPGKLTILVVEDNKDMRNYIRSVLTEQYNILEAENGSEALHILTTTNVDFIVSDLMMPVMDGIELSKRVKENFSISHIPFLMLTAKTSQETRLESYRMGVDEYLLKPFSEELLLTRISNILENRKRYQRQFAQSMEIDALQIEEKSSDKKFLDKALEVIKANYKNSYYESADFIEAMGVSKSLLNKKMQNLTGQSIGQFIRNYRLNIARELINKNRITKNMNISEVAYEVGFNDPKYFTRCFTKRYNVTPSSLLENEQE